MDTGSGSAGSNEAPLMAACQRMSLAMLPQVAPDQSGTNHQSGCGAAPEGAAHSYNHDEDANVTISLPSRLPAPLISEVTGSPVNPVQFNIPFGIFVRKHRPLMCGCDPHIRTMSAKTMTPRNTMSSFSNREKMRRSSFNRRMAHPPTPRPITGSRRLRKHGP